jgi:hypothetical protein
VETEINADAYVSPYLITKQSRLLASLDVYSSAPFVECTIYCTTKF